MSGGPPRDPRRRLLASLVLAGALAWLFLGLSPADLVPDEAGRGVLRRFLAGAVSPALDYEADAPPGSPPLVAKVARAMGDTLVFALAGMSLALVIGVVLGFLGSTARWGRRAGTAGRWFPLVLCRLLIAGLRSVHELLWAVLFLAAFGLTPFSAVLAIALPYGGSLAKVFSEMLDESPRSSAEALEAIGARPLEGFLCGLVPRALPDLASYAFYRLECAVRSSAVLGFFGVPTLGYYLKLSVENVHFREVWTYLYALLALVLVFELWSSRLRARVVAR